MADIAVTPAHRSRVWCHHCQTMHVLRVPVGVRIDSLDCPRCGIHFVSNAIVGRCLIVWPWERVKSA